MSDVSLYTDSEQASLRKIERDTSFTLGQYGAVYENGTDAVTGNFGCITALEDSAFSALTAANWTGDSTASLPLKAGVTIFGNFTGFTLSSGKVVAYNKAS